MAALEVELRELGTETESEGDESESAIEGERSEIA